MNELMSPIYIVRAGDFGADLAPRFWLSVLALALLLWDTWRNRRLDYLWIYMIGLLVWTVVEAVLQSFNIRDIVAQSLFGVTLPITLAVLLQGSAEGASVAVLGIFLGDRLTTQHTRAKAIIVVLTLCLLLVVRAFVSEAARPQSEFVAASRRDVAVTAPLAFAGLATLFLLFSMFRPEHRRRMAAMAGAVFAVASVWTATQYYSGTRWVEITDNGTSGYLHATGMITAVTLGFDVFVEIALAYSAFYMIAALARIVSPIPLPCRNRGTFKRK